MITNKFKLLLKHNDTVTVLDIAFVIVSDVQPQPPVPKVTTEPPVQPSQAANVTETPAPPQPKVIKAGGSSKIAAKVGHGGPSHRRKRH